MQVCSSTENGPPGRATSYKFLQFLSTFSAVLGTIGLVFYAFPYLGIIFPPLIILYYAASVYYRRSSVEAKRMDSLLRSFLYGSYTGSIYQDLLVFIFYLSYCSKHRGINGLIDHTGVWASGSSTHFISGLWN